MKKLSFQGPLKILHLYVSKNEGQARLSTT
jgi:hypothetical protein